MYDYMMLMQKLSYKSGGEEARPDRTNTGTASIFDHTLEFNLGQYFPLLPFRQMGWKNVVTELVWFLRGDTKIEFLEKHGCNWWSNQCSTDGDVGPMYGAQWRGYKGMDGIQRPDQFRTFIDGLRKDPFGRRHVVDSWEASAIPENNCDYDANVKAGKMAIAPCHLMYQAYVDVRNGQKYIDLKFYMRSSDTFLGLPANIASYAMLLEIISALTGYKVGRLIYNGGDVHLYSNHDRACTQLLKQWQEMVHGELKHLNVKQNIHHSSWIHQSEKLCPSFKMPAEFHDLVNADDLDFTADNLIDVLCSGLHGYKPGGVINARMAR